MFEFTGTITGINNNVIDGSTSVTFAVNEGRKVVREYERLKDVDKLRIKVDKYREKRSLNANAYLWALLQKMAEVLNTTKDELYIQMLDVYGQFTFIIVKPEAVERVKSKWRTCRDMGELHINGQVGIQLQCFYGSSTYDTREMSKLIDGVVYECKELGIETLTPAELERMKSSWRPKG